MGIFVALALAGFIFLAGAFIFGHDFDHDIDHDVGGHDFGGHDVGHDADHGAEGESGGTISIFSFKVIATFVMGFGAAGAVAYHYGLGNGISSLAGIGTGFCLAMLMYGLLLLFVKQQSSSVISNNALIGHIGTVTLAIDKGSLGEVGLSVGGQYLTYSARAVDDIALVKGAQVRVLSVVGSTLNVGPAAEY